jgi:UDP-N-acetylmuramoyl-L-alanyl-D-glutamate--2,6-diaminopimelate ligase
VKLKKLLKKVPLALYKGSREVQITGITSHSKLVAPGNLFIAKKGFSDDGSKYIEEAISNGAAVILSDMGNPFLKNVTQLVHSDISAVEAKLAAAYHDYPARHLFITGVTGTNGKTTTTYLIKHILDQYSETCGLIGTIECVTGKARYPSERTTPDAITNQKLLREMLKNGCTSAVLEVSSHGLKQGRVREIDFDVAVFTNLTQDHLDYHETMEDYVSAKALLFSSLDPSRTAIINEESPWNKRIIRDCNAKIITYGLTSSSMLYANDINFSSETTSFTVNYGWESQRFNWPQIGRYNILNALAAIGVALVFGVPFSLLPHLFSSFTSVSGRLQRVGNSSIFVDYAHTPDALENVLKCLKEISKGRIITVFGCGGDRDKGKRPLMAQACEHFSDFSIVTSDNPRTENPDEICRQIIVGFKKNCYSIEADRRAAIRQAIQMAQKEDLILIAGKGHETYQIFSHQTIPFDDRKVALEILAEMNHP